MNKDIQERITGYLDAIESHADKAGDFIVEQTPLLAQEYLVWYWWEHALVLAGGVLFLLTVPFSIYLAYKVGKIFREAEPVIGAGILALIGLIAGLSMIWTSTAHVIKVSVAPRVVLLEAAKDLLP